MMIDTPYKCTKCGLSTNNMKAHEKVCNPATSRLKHPFLQRLGRGRGSQGVQIAGAIELAFLRGLQHGHAAEYKRGYSAGYRARKRAVKKLDAMDKEQAP